MWVLTSDEPHTLYNLSAFDVVVAIPGEVVDEKERPFAEYRWTVVAQDRHGSGAVQLAGASTRKEADNIVRAIADAIHDGKLLMDLGAD